MVPHEKIQTSYFLNHPRSHIHKNSSAESHLMFRHVTMSCSVLTHAGRHVGRARLFPGCRGRPYACLRLYAFDPDGALCWPACTRLLCNDGSWKPTDNIISECQL